jgi:hypothetical protein
MDIWAEGRDYAWGSGFDPQHSKKNKVAYVGCILFFAVLRIEPAVSHMQGKRSTLSYSPALCVFYFYWTVLL